MIYIKKEDGRYVIYNDKRRVNSLATLNGAIKSAKRLFRFSKIVVM
jgi:hypothetical protein